MRFFGLVLFTVLFLFNFVRSNINLEAGAACVLTDYRNVSKAIQNRVCTHIVLDNLDIPGGQTLELPMRDGTRLSFRGNITFGYAEWEGPLMSINGTNLLIEGEDGSVLNGQGQLYWDGLGEWGSVKPKFLTLQLHNSVMSGVNVLNSPVHAVLLTDSTNVKLSEWFIDNQLGDPSVAGPGKAGHNTDGFDIWNSTDISIQNTIVYNQDDCVAIRNGANILVDDVICYGSHGLSISVGFSNDSFKQNTLHNVTISNSILKGGENAIHIKTHVDGSYGLIQNVTYRNIVFDGPVKYGINIQENYRNLPANGTQPHLARNNIPIRNLTLDNVIGYVDDSAVPIYIFCADNGCLDWKFNNVLVRGTKNNSCNYVPDNFSCY